MFWWYLFLLASFGSVLSMESRVYSGDDLRFDMHKHLVKLNIRGSRFISSCSGSILDESWVITSAHCLNGMEKQIGVFHQTEKGQRNIAKIDLTNVHVHPLYNPADKSSTNDLALLKTASSIKFSDHIQPIKLSPIYPRSKLSAIIAGFGNLEPGLEPPREGFVEVLPCFENLLCSVDLVRAGSGDSGGPLVSHGKLIGVTSASCTDVEKEKPCITVYASVAMHYRWIQEVIYGNILRRVK